MGNTGKPILGLGGLILRKEDTGGKEGKEGNVGKMGQ